jgi:hypothetical protein
VSGFTSFKVLEDFAEVAAHARATKAELDKAIEKAKHFN